MESLLVLLCIEAATQTADAVEKWRRQRRTVERMPSHLAEALIRRLLHRRLLFPSLLEVFKYSVEEIDLRGESCVDAEWMAYLGAFRYLRSINLADCHRMNNSAVWSLSGLTNLKEVDLSRCSKVTDAGIRHLLSVPAIEKLFISQTGVTSDGVRMLASLTNLLMLDLGGLPVSDSALISLQVLMKLKYLDIWGSEVSNKGAAILKKFPSLSFLNLAWTNVTDLPILPSLSTLNMSNCAIHSLFEGEGQNVCLEKAIFSGATFTNASEVFHNIETSKLVSLDISTSAIQSFGFLSFMKSLVELNLRDSALLDDLVEPIACIGAKLRYLNLSNTKVSSEGIGALAGHVPNLETLLLSGTSINDKAIIYISMMPSLKIINLNRTNVNGLIHQKRGDSEEVLSFSALESLNLERLDLEKVDIKDNAVWPLTKLQNLRHLSLQSVSLTDVSLHHMSTCTKLEHLGIRDGVLTDGGLLSFLPPRALKVLDLRGSWLMTKDIVMHFYHKYPQIEVKHDLVKKVDRRNFEHSTTSQANMAGGSHLKQKQKNVHSVMPDENFLDQRLKYSKEELLQLQFSSAGASTSHPCLTLW